MKQTIIKLNEISLSERIYRSSESSKVSRTAHQYDADIKKRKVRGNKGKGFFVCLREHEGMAEAEWCLVARLAQGDGNRLFREVHDAHVALLSASQLHQKTLLSGFGMWGPLRSISGHRLHCSTCVQLLTLKRKHWPDHTETHSEARLKWHLTDVLALNLLTSSGTNNKFINRDPAWIPSMGKTFSYS